MSITRRRFLATAVAGGTVLAAAGRPAFAQGGGPLPKIARWRRYDVACPEGQRMLVSYERGVRAMLALPPEDPRNWFRYAFTHFFDCPHGNWWFYAWHRGYVGYFERIIRELSGDIDFAMPYSAERSRPPTSHSRPTPATSRSSPTSSNPRCSVTGRRCRRSSCSS
jgi:tyrosinase